MEIMKGLLLEDPRSLWIALGIAEIVVLVLWSRLRPRWSLYVLFALPAVAVLLGLLDLAVETDYEAVCRSVRMMGRAARNRNVDAFVERISPQYASGRYRKEDLAGLVRFGMPQVDVSMPLRADVKMGEPGATVWHTYIIHSRPGARFRLHQAVKWEATFGEDPDGEWRLRAVIMVGPFRGSPEQYRPKLR